MEYIKPIHYGAKNENVSKIQEYINWFHYLKQYPYAIKVDGIFGIVTQTAIKFITANYNVEYNNSIISKPIIDLLQAPLHYMENVDIEYQNLMPDFNLNNIICNYLEVLSQKYIYYNVTNNYFYNNSGGPFTRYLLQYNTNLRTIHCNAIFVVYILNKMRKELRDFMDSLNLKNFDMSIIDKLFYTNNNAFIFNKHFMELIKRAKNNNILFYGRDGYIPTPGDIFIDINYYTNFLHTGFVKEVGVEQLTFLSMEHILVFEGKSIVYKHRNVNNYQYISLKEIKD